MEGITVGEIIALEDKKEFICFSKIQDDGKDYLFLMSNFKPVEVIIAEEIIEDGVLQIRKFSDPAKKKHLLQRFREQSPSAALMNTLEQSDPEKESDGTVQTDCICVGETVELENMGEYICFQKVQDQGQEYLIMMSKEKPKKLLVGTQNYHNGVLRVQIVEDPEITNRLLRRIRSNPFAAFKQIFQKTKRRR